MPVSIASRRRSSVCGVQPDRERTVVHELDGHLGPELTLRDRHAEIAKRSDEPFDELDRKSVV